MVLYCTAGVWREVCISGVDLSGGYMGWWCGCCGFQRQLRFNAPPPGVYMVTVLLMSDFWIGCEKRITLKLKVGKRTRADREGRAANAPGSAAAAAAMSDAGSDSDLDDEYADDGGEVRRVARV